MKLGDLEFTAVEDNLDLVAKPVGNAVSDFGLKNVLVAKIDPSLADTAAFCEHYKIGVDVSANCIVVEAKRADKVWYAACVTLATTKADVNGIIRKHLGARKISFASMDKAVDLTGMAYGGITPIGLPAEWPILIDSAVLNTEHVVIGSGIRESKLLVSITLLVSLKNTTSLDIKIR